VIDDDQPQLLSAAQVAKIFGKNIRTLHDWAEAEVLVPATHIRGRRYYAVADVERLLGLKRP
jgi:DNA-binding transcriptional MerR regulator